MKPRIPAPAWDGYGNYEKAGKCTIFPPTREYDPWFDDEDEAIRICNGDHDGKVCPLRHQCLIFALINNEQGVWGGMFLHDRKRLRRTVPRSEWRWEPPTEPEEPQSDPQLDEEPPSSLAA